MAGQSGSNIAAASVGGYELALGSKPRELMLSVNGFVPGGVGAAGASHTIGVGAYIHPSGAWATGLAGVGQSTAASSGASGAMTLTSPSTTTVTIDGETLSTVVAVPGSMGYGSGILNDSPLTSAGQYVTDVGTATANVPTGVIATPASTVLEALPLVESVNFGAGSLVMNEVASNQSVMGFVVFGAGDGKDDLNIIDAQIAFAYDGTSNSGTTLTGKGITTFASHSLSGSSHTFTETLISATAAVTAISGGTVHFVISSATDTQELVGLDNYRMTVRALAHPKGGI